MLKASFDAIKALSECFDEMREDVAKLTSDNECLTVEMQHQREALGSLYELKFTLNVADALTEQISTLGEQAVTEEPLQSSRS